jgi:predicted NBD/HSP70 family sugar kinase
MTRTKSRRLEVLGVQDVRDTNETRFLHLIRDRQPVSRTDLALETGLRPGTVSLVVNRLLRAGFVCEAEEAPSKGGRRAVYLQVNAEKAYAVGISIGVHQSIYLVSDFNGRILSQRSVLTGHDPKNFLIKLGKEIAGHLENNYRRSQFRAVGVTAPGLVDREEGKLVYSPNLGWVDVPVARLLEQSLQLPIYLENDANAAALSELWYGPIEIAGASSLLFVLVVEGIGTGFILHGELHIGSRIGSGGFGHMQLDSQGPACSCGNIGCWEALASNDATVKHFLESHPERAGQIRSIRDLVSAAANGDQAARDELLRMASLIAKGIRGLAQGLAPEVIVLGGEITEAWPLIEATLHKEIQSGYLIEGVSQPKLRRASVDHPGMFGTIPLCLRSMFQNRGKRIPEAVFTP